MANLNTVTGIGKSVVKSFAKQARKSGFTENGTGIRQQLESGVTLFSNNNNGILEIMAEMKDKNGTWLRDFFEAGANRGKAKYIKSTVNNKVGSASIYPGKKGFLGIGRKNGRIRLDVITRELKYKGDVSGLPRTYEMTLNPTMTKIKQAFLAIFDPKGRELQNRYMVPSEEAAKAMKATMEANAQGFKYYG